jgi:hypothetical protein
MVAKLWTVIPIHWLVSNMFKVIFHRVSAAKYSKGPFKEAEFYRET